MRKLTDKQALEFGIQPVHHQMDNGELRFRLTRDTGSSYILTLSADQSGWQFSHVHHQKREFYIVEQGWIVLALRQSEQLTFRRLGPDDSFMLPPGLPHNVYLFDRQFALLFRKESRWCDPDRYHSLHVQHFSCGCDCSRIEHAVSGIPDTERGGG